MAAGGKFSFIGRIACYCGAGGSNAVTDRAKFGITGWFSTFLHPDTVAFNDRQVISAPGYIVLHPPSTLRGERGKLRKVPGEDFRAMAWGECEASSQNSTFGHT